MAGGRGHADRQSDLPLDGVTAQFVIIDSYNHEPPSIPGCGYGGGLRQGVWRCPWNHVVGGTLWRRAAGVATVATVAVVLNVVLDVGCLHMADGTIPEIRL